MYAMFNLMLGLKKGVAHCCSVCSSLNEKELTIISYVGQKQNVKMSEIAEKLDAPLSTLTSIVDKLVEKKYLLRYHSSEDRRVVLVTLATNGKEIHSTLIAKKQDMAKKIMKEFNPNDQEVLIKYLEKIPSILNKKS